MSDKQALTRAAWRSTGEYELENGHERRRRIRSERMRQWRKEMRRRRPNEFDDRAPAAIAGRAAP